MPQDQVATEAAWLIPTISAQDCGEHHSYVITLSTSSPKGR